MLLFLYCRSLCRAAPFYLRPPLVHNTSCALFAFCRSLFMCFCAAFAFFAPCLSASCFPFPIGFSLFGRFLRGSDILLLLRSILRAPFVTQQVPLPLPSLRLRHILLPPFYIFALFLAKVRKRKREFLHFNRKKYSFHGIFLSNIFGSLAKKLYFCIDCCREITCLVKSSLVFVLVGGYRLVAPKFCLYHFHFALFVVS